MKDYGMTGKNPNQSFVYKGLNQYFKIQFQVHKKVLS